MISAMIAEWSPAMNVTGQLGFVNLHTVCCDHSPMSDVTSIFVYGTLKRGKCRAGCWPCTPRLVEPASTLATLYDLGPYPALLAGSDRVLGEIWTFAAIDVAETLRVLDQIECFGQDDVDLYIRMVVPCNREVETGGSTPAYCYFLADAATVGSHQRVAPEPDGFCRWPGTSRA